MASFSPAIRELQRKLFHMLSFTYAALYAWLPAERCLVVMAILGVGILGLEVARYRIPRFKAWSWGQFGGIARPWEKDSPSGLLSTWLGCLLTFLLFRHRGIVLAALGFMILGDAAAAVVGRAWGRHPWRGQPGKSLEGSGAFVVASSLWGMAFLPPAIVVPAALVTAWLESRRLPLDDNLWIPVLSGICMTLTWNFFVS